MTDKVQLAKQNVEAFGKGDWASFKAPLSEDSIYAELATQRRVQGPDAIVELSKGWRQAFPDAKGTITKAVERGDTVVLQINSEGTHNGDLKGALRAPSGRRFPRFLLRHELDLVPAPLAGDAGPQRAADRSSAAAIDLALDAHSSRRRRIPYHADRRRPGGDPRASPPLLHVACWSAVVPAGPLR